MDPVQRSVQEHLDKLHELQRLWLNEAVKYNVLPLDYRQIERFIPDKAGRPTLIKGNTQLLFGGMGRLSENSRPRSMRPASSRSRIHVAFVGVLERPS